MVDVFVLSKKWNTTPYVYGSCNHLLVFCVVAVVIPIAFWCSIIDWMVCKLYTNMAKQKVRETPASKPGRISWVRSKSRKVGWNIGHFKRKFTASVVGPFTAFQLAGNIDCNKEKLSYLKRAITEE